MSDWTEFGVREGMSISARSPVREIPEVAAVLWGVSRGERRLAVLNHSAVSRRMELSPARKRIRTGDRRPKRFGRRPRDFWICWMHRRARA